jgi:hypothetical protein
MRVRVGSTDPGDAHVPQSSVVTNGTGDQNGSGLPALLGVATALIAGIGSLALTGALGRVQRNHGEEFAVALAFAILGAGFWAAGAVWGKRTHVVGRVAWAIGGVLVAVAGVLIVVFLSGAEWLGWVLIVVGGLSAVAHSELGGRLTWTQAAWQWAGLALAAVGLVVGFSAAVNTANDTEQPELALKVDAQSELTGTAKVSDLGTGDRLAVEVDGLNRPRDQQGKEVPGSGYQITDTLYQGYVGPDSDGNVSHNFDVRVPPGRYEAIGAKAWTTTNPHGCNEPLKQVQREADRPKSGTACLVRVLPAPPQRPQLAATWEGSGSKGDSLKLTVASANEAVGKPSDRVVLVQVDGLMKKRSVSLLVETVDPDAAGETRREIRVPVQKGVRMVCVDARLVVPGGPQTSLPSSQCPLDRESSAGEAVELRVPRSSSQNPAAKKDP